MLVDGKRELAYIQTVHDIEPIVGADNIEKVHVLGWELIAKKKEFKEGDKCVYIEIDSLVPFDNPVFDFLASKHYKVKTYKLGKFGVVSQGLALPLSAFPQLGDLPVNSAVTEKLNITYAVKEDNERKQTPGEAAEISFKAFQARHKKLFSSFIMRHLMKIKWFRKLMKAMFGKKKVDKRTSFPKQFIRPTDEERVQNMPAILRDKSPFIVTEKIDGTSTTFLLERKGKNKFEFYVCSRNKRVFYEKTAVYHGNDNIYCLMADKYKIEETLKDYLNKNKELSWVCIQGESFGPKWQGNPLQVKELDFRAFNFITSAEGRIGTLEGRDILSAYGIQWVPIIYTDYVLPDTVNELLEAATGPATLNTKVMREGWVIRSQDGKTSFKAVSPAYLLKRRE